jgi:PleD family two-component response regulator
VNDIYGSNRVLKNKESRNSSFSGIKISKDTCNCKKVCIVDDEPFNLMALEGIFNQLGIETEKFIDGQYLIDHML